MPARISIGIACPIPSERAAFMDWLDAAGYACVPMLDVDDFSRKRDTRPIEALVVDAALLTAGGLSAVMKTLTANRPLIAVGSGDHPPDLRRQAHWLARPASAESLAMTIALALAEGRPARRSPRLNVMYLPATVDGVRSQILDVSNEGVRVKLQGAGPSALPPFFTLKVESFDVAAVVRRVWVAQPGDGTVLCGGNVKTDSRSRASWKRLVDIAPTTGSILSIPAAKR